MKIVLINGFDSVGGAALMAYNLFKGLHEYKSEIKTTFIVGTKTRYHSEIFSTRRNKWEEYIEKGIDKVFNAAGLQYQWFPFSTSSLLKQIKTIKPDIISLHNLHGGYFQIEVLPKLAEIAPLVWTFHDMWPFTGHCAYSFDCEKWSTGCKQCPNLMQYPSIGGDLTSFLWKQKRSIYKKIPLTIVSPSKWLKELAEKSPLLINSSINCIPNGINQKKFRPLDIAFCKQVFNIPKNEPSIMFNAHLLNARQKGGYLLQDVLKEISQLTSDKIHVLILGKGSLENLYLDFNNQFIFHQVGYIDSPELMALCYNAADLLLFLSKAENLSLVLLEAISCGTPCITFSVGGCPEIIQPEKSGVLIKPFDTKSFAIKAVEMLSDKNRLRSLSKETVNFAEKNFNLETEVSKYCELFENVLSIQT